VTATVTIISVPVWGTAVELIKTSWCTRVHEVSSPVSHSASQNLSTLIACLFSDFPAVKISSLGEAEACLLFPDSTWFIQAGRGVC
jgi:hypothetical protein